MFRVFIGLADCAKRFQPPKVSALDLAEGFLQNFADAYHSSVSSQ
jgi:hypothetical protein